jgi:molybdate transport system regulatory protein
MHKEAPKLTIRVDLSGGRALGPGKIRLLEAIDKTGSISEAGRELNMSYKRAWQMVDDLNGCFRAPVIKPRRGGGTALAPLGMKLVELYRMIEANALTAVSRHLRALELSLRRSTASMALTSIKRPLRNRGSKSTISLG